MKAKKCPGVCRRSMRSRPSRPRHGTRALPVPPRSCASPRGRSVTRSRRWLRDAFDRIAVGTERLLQRQSAGVLTLSTSPDFAAKWLVHRLARFAELHPAIDLRIGAALHHIDFAREDVDLAIRHGDGQANGLHMTRLCTEELMLVCN